MEGTIRSAGAVSVGQSGQFNGEVYADRVVISGFVRGRVECEMLEIVEKGKLYGEVSCNDFVIEPGGHFEGESRSKGQVTSPGLSHIAEWSGEPRLESKAAADADEGSLSVSAS